MKKIVAVVLMTLMIVGLLGTTLTTSAVTPGDITATVKVTDPKEGKGQVKVTVKIENNPGLNTLVLNLGYNDETLSVNSITNGELFVESNNASMFEVNTENNPLVLYFDVADVSNVSADGKICTVLFDIEDDTGTFDITFAVDKTNTYKSDGGSPIKPIDVELTSQISGTKNTQHVYTGTPTVIPPTCTEPGHTDQVCNTCGKVLNSTPGRDPLGHDLKTETVDPTYYKEGYRKVYCQRAGCEYVESETVLPKLTVEFRINTVDEKGNKISDGKIVDVNVGELDIDALAPQIPGYTLVPGKRAEASENGEFNFIDAVYAPNTDIEYTVKYVDKNGKELADAKKVTGCTMAATVTENAAAVPGYKADENSKSLKLEADKNEIVFVYEALKTAPESPKTGDNMLTLIVVLMSAVALATVVTVVRKKKED